MNNSIVIQARTSSTRLPNKILLKIQNIPLIEILIRRLLFTEIPIILAVPKNTYPKITFLKKYNIEFFTGDEENVLKRYYECAQNFNIDNIIRVTADNPFTSVYHIKKIIKAHIKNNADLSYIDKLPYGTGVEVIKFKALEKQYFNAENNFQKEHITQYIYKYKNKFNIYTEEALGIYNNPNIRLTVDTKQDFLRTKKIIMDVPRDKDSYIRLSDIIKYLKG